MPHIFAGMALRAFSRIEGFYTIGLLAIAALSVIAAIREGRNGTR